MRKITYCLILFLFIYPLSLMADNGVNESVLKELDRVIEEKYCLLYTSDAADE